MMDNAKLNVLSGMMKPIMSMVSGWMKDVEPENSIATWVEANIGLFARRTSCEVVVDEDALFAEEFITKLAVMEANKHPADLLNRLVVFNNSFVEFYKDAFPGAYLEPDEAEDVDDQV